MALQDLPVRIALRGGIDKKTDQRLVIPSKLTEAYDIEFDGSDIVTRWGLEQRVLAGAFTTPVRMIEHNKVPIIEFNDGATVKAAGNAITAQFAAAALSHEVDKFARVGVITRRAQALLQKPTAPGAGVPLYDRNFDVAVGNVNYCIAWEEPGYNGRMAVKYSIRQLDTDAELFQGIFSATGVGTDVYVKPRVIFNATNSKFLIAYAHFQSGGIVYDVEGFHIDENITSFAGPTVMIAVNGGGGGAVEGAVGLEALFDVAWNSTLNYYCAVARHTNAAGNVYMRVLGNNLAAITAASNAAPAIKPVSLTAHATYAGGVVTCHALYGAGANLRGYRHPSNTGVQSAEVTITTITGLVGRVAVTQYVVGPTEYLLIAFDNFTATTAIFAQSYIVQATVAHAFTAQTQVGTNCFLSGRMFTMRSRVYLPMTFTSAQYQSVTLVLDVTCAIRNFGVATRAQPYFVARLDWGDTANPSTGTLSLDSAHRVPSAFEALMPYLKFETNTRLAGVTNVTPVAVTFAKFASTEHLGHKEWNGCTYLAGALPLVLDGVQIVEENFHWAPEVVGVVANGLVTVAPVATGTGIYDFPAVGTYIVAFTESWEDAQGNWHESGTAFLCSVTTTVGNLAINPTIIRPPSLKRDQSKLVAGYLTGLTMYRTKGSSTDTTRYLAHSNELGAGTGYISDTDLGSGELLYTEGGVVGNTPAPACRQMTAFNERLVLTGCGDGSRIYWSKQQSPGFAAEFVTDEVPFQQTIKPEIGRGVASIEMGGKLVIVGEEAFGIMYGTGPDSTGLGKYASIETISVGMGALWTAPKSVHLATEGIWFQSPFGLRLFTGADIARGAGGMFVGSELDPLVTFHNDPIVTLAGGNSQQVRFFSAIQAYVWDQTWGQFAVYQRHQSVDACLVSGVYFILQNNAGTPRLQSPSIGLLNDSADGVQVRGLIQTAPIQVAGIQGFQRVRRMLLLGSCGSSSFPSFDVQVAYDGEQVAAIEVSAGPTPSPAGVFQFQHQFTRQKCQSMLLRLTFNDGIGLSRIRLTDLALAVGVKYGTSRTPESK